MENNRITDPNLRGQDDQNQIVNQQDQNNPVNPGPRDYNKGQQGREEEQEERLIDHSFETEEYERNDDPEIETPSPKEDSGADSTEKKIPNF